MCESQIQRAGDLRRGERGGAPNEWSSLGKDGTPLLEVGKVEQSELPQSAFIEGKKRATIERGLARRQLKN